VRAADRKAENRLSLRVKQLARTNSAFPEISGLPVGVPQAATSFAPVTTRQPFTEPKPHPDRMELRLAPSSDPAEVPPPRRQSAIDAPVERESANASLHITLPARLAIAASALDRVERKQVETLAKLRTPLLAAAERLRIALAATGLCQTG
jgi:hypothetical protein